MKVEEILTRLEGVRQCADGWIARCPAHEDRSPSLSVGEGRDGRVLLHCHAGCTADRVCAALGISMGHLFTEPSARHKPEPQIVSDAQRQIGGLRSRLTPRDRERGVTVVLASETNLDAAITRALVLAVEGELVQIVLDGNE